MKLQSNVAIITGGSRGIGKAIAIEFAKEGAHVVLVVDKDIEGANNVAREVKAIGSKALVVRADVSKRKDANRIVEETLKNFGRIDILVNNAGISQVDPSIELSERKWNRVLRINLSGVFFCSQAVAKVMVKQKKGKIINIASIAGEAAFPRRAAYCASKSGVIMLTKVLAIEWAQHNIQVNAIAPGYVETELVLDLIREKLINVNDLERRIPMHRLAKPEEIAKVAVFLASDDASYLTGATLYVDGGWIAYGYI